MDVPQWSLIQKNINEIKTYHKNPRTIREARYAGLKKSIDKFGFIDKPIVNIDFTLIAGHQRLRVLKENGVQTVDVWHPSRELTPKEVEELNIRHNHDTGEFEIDILANEFEYEDLKEWGLDDIIPDMGKDFEPGTEEQQSKLDQKQPITCPNCDHQWVR